MAKSIKAAAKRGEAKKSVSKKISRA